MYPPKTVQMSLTKQSVGVDEWKFSPASLPRLVNVPINVNLHVHHRAPARNFGDGEI